VIPLPPPLFEARLPGLGRPLTDREGEQLVKYLKLLVKWQKTHRLLGSVDPAWVVENVFLDSLCFLGALPHGIASIADVGSGAGVPGIPMAIVRPDISFSLIEARERRASFLSTVVRELALAHVEVVPARVETLEHRCVGGFDAVVMRCAGEISAVLGSALRLVRGGGVVIVSAPPGPQDLPGAEAIAVRSFSGSPRTFHRFTKV
jgi:16S rRNA (guanine527-N7)-methyltransferase